MDAAKGGGGCIGERSWNARGVDPGPGPVPKDPVPRPVGPRPVGPRTVGPSPVGPKVPGPDPPGALYRLSNTLNLSSNTLSFSLKLSASVFR